MAQEEYTLTYSESVNGWPSFYSFIPDFILGMNQYLYTFKNGNLFKHNSNNTRNNYYDVQYNSKITSVFNQEPTTTKVFKTIELESDDSWDCSLVSDLGSGFMPSTYFIKKEGTYFSYIRRLANSKNLSLRSAQGIGTIKGSTGVGPNPITIEFGFLLGSMINIGDASDPTSVGDVAYYNNSGTPVEIGEITGISADNKSITIDNPVIVGALPASYILYLKNSVAESYGALGYFLEFTLTNSNTEPVELFTVDSDVFKSNP